MEDTIQKTKLTKLSIALIGCLLTAFLGFSLGTLKSRADDRRIKVNQKAAEGWLEEVRAELGKTGLTSGDYVYVRASDGKVRVYAIVMDSDAESSFEEGSWKAIDRLGVPKEIVDIDASVEPEYLKLMAEVRIINQKLKRKNRQRPMEQGSQQ